MRSLVVLDHLPFPPRSGQTLRYLQAIDALRRQGPVHLLQLSPTAVPRPPLPPGVSLTQLVRETPIGPTHRRARLLGSKLKRRLRAWLDRRHQARIHRRIARLLKRFEPACVLVERAELVAYLPRPLGCPVVYDAHNVEKSLRPAIIAAAEGSERRSAIVRVAQAAMAGEAEIMTRADQVWVCSESDRKLLADAYGTGVPVSEVPNCVDNGRLARIAALRRTRPPQGKTLLYVGDYGYPPNLDAAQRLIGAIAPGVLRRMPDVRVVLCGRRAPTSLTATASRTPWLELTGEVDDIAGYLADASLLIVPLRQGGGTRLKILEAFAAGLPVVSTPKGAEGLAAEHEVHLRLADDEAGLVAQSLAVLGDVEAANAMAERASVLVAGRYSWEANASRVDRALKDLLGAHAEGRDKAASA